jgi:hypothetical protein
MRCCRAQGPVKALYKLEDDADKAEQKLLAAQKRKEEIPKMMQCVKRPVATAGAGAAVRLGRPRGPQSSWPCRLGCRLEAQDLDNQTMKLTHKVQYDLEVTKYKLSKAIHDRDLALAKLADDRARAEVCPHGEPPPAPPPLSDECAVTNHYWYGCLEPRSLRCSSTRSACRVARAPWRRRPRSSAGYVKPTPQNHTMAPMRVDRYSRIATVSTGQECNSLLSPPGPRPRRRRPPSTQRLPPQVCRLPRRLSFTGIALHGKGMAHRGKQNRAGLIAHRRHRRARRGRGRRAHDSDADFGLVLQRHGMLVTHRALRLTHGGAWGWDPCTEEERMYKSRKCRVCLCVHSSSRWLLINR